MDGIHLVNDHGDLSRSCEGRASEETGLGFSAALISRGEELLLRHGRAFRITPATMAGKRMSSRNSFANAMQAAVRDVRLTYVDGYCHADGASFTHGWVVNPYGVVIEPTLPRWATPRAYFGIAFKTAYLEGNFKSSGVSGPMLFVNPELYLLDAATLSKKVISDDFKGDALPLDNILAWRSW